MKFCATCPFGKNAKDYNCCWIYGSKDHYVDKFPNQSKKKTSLKFLNMNLEFQIFEYELIFGYQVNSNDESIYELILEYSNTSDSKDYSLKESSKNEKG